MHVNTEKRQDEIVHVYLDGARVLRPDPRPLSEGRASSAIAGVGLIGGSIALRAHAAGLRR